MLPATEARVPQQTAEHVNREIRRRTETNVARVVADGPGAIARRLVELDSEWDIERLLETNAGTAVVIGCVLGATVDRRFFALPAIVGAFLVQHALQGWCPPLPVFRRMGVRTTGEIEDERRMLRRAQRPQFSTDLHRSDVGITCDP